jgi:hypothetical protein
MKYLLLIYTNEANEAARPEAEQQDVIQRYFAYTEMVRQKGKLVACDALQPVGTATSVRKRNGKVLTTDGPFAETKEQLGGFYLVDCKDLDEALDLAAQIPSSEHGTIEVRPIMSFE